MQEGQDWKRNQFILAILGLRCLLDIHVEMLMEMEAVRYLNLELRKRFRLETKIWASKYIGGI